MRGFISKLSHKIIILVLALVIVVFGTSIVEKQFNLSSKLSRMAGEVAGVVIINDPGKFLPSVSIASATGTAPYQNVSGDVAISGNVNIGSASQFQINTTGAITASTGITNSGGYSQSGTTANTFTGTSTFSNSTYSALFTGGNVGIGLAAPTDILHVYSNIPGYNTSIRVESGSGANFPLLKIYDDRAGGKQWQIENGRVPGALGIYATGATGGVGQVMTFLPNGNVGIGISATAPAARLQVDGTGYSGIIRIRNTNAVAGKFWQIGPDQNNAFVVYNQTGNTGAYILDNGLPVASGQSWGWNVPSDQRLKTNIKTLDTKKGLQAINQLNPVTFNWIDVRSTKAPQTGFIAQEVQKILPELVSNAPESNINLPNGLTQKISNTLGLNYTAFVPYLVKAIQEQQKEIDSLKHEIELLKAK